MHQVTQEVDAGTLKTDFQIVQITGSVRLLTKKERKKPNQSINMKLIYIPCNIHISIYKKQERNKKVASSDDIVTIR